jgi:hypothetical protein
MDLEPGPLPLGREQFREALPHHRKPVPGQHALQRHVPVPVEPFPCLVIDAARGDTEIGQRDRHVHVFLL